MKDIKINPKNNFNLEIERGKYLKIFGESPIFFGSIMKLIWINGKKTIKRNFKNSKILGPSDLPH